MNNQYVNLVHAFESMGNLSETIEDTKLYQKQIVTLNDNLKSLNGVYGNVLNAFGRQA